MLQKLNLLLEDNAPPIPSLQAPNLLILCGFDLLLCFRVSQRKWAWHFIVAWEALPMLMIPQKYF